MGTLRDRIDEILSDCDSIKHYLERKNVSIKRIMEEIDKEHKVLRPVLRWFAGGMEIDLRKNDSKGGWLDDELGYYREKALKHLRVLKDIDSIKFITTASKKKAIAHCVKSANYSMMLAHNMIREVARLEEEEGGSCI